MHFNHFFRWIFSVILVFSGIMACDDSSRNITAENCTNGRDDDGDGRIDCLDTDCAWHNACLNVSEDCSNGRDDDGDNKIDCADFDCRNDPYCLGLTENCSNRIDDDADGLVDCNDPDCSAHSACWQTGEYCNNHQDDDGDGLIDCDDPDCAAYSECLPDLEICTNSLDDDGDGFIDCDDPDCASHTNCFNDTSATCGNGTLDYGEECDTWNLDGFQCEDLGYNGGYLYCSAQCSFSVSGCFDCGNGLCENGENQVNCPADCNTASLCGNGTIGSNEECDGTNLHSETCTTLNVGYHGGTLRCSSSCLFDTSGCYYCGNYICETGENTTNCQVDCQFAVNCGNGLCESGETLSNCPSDCYASGVCGNGIVETGEACDGSNLGGKTCLTYGYNQGTLTCYSTCQANISNCSNTGTVELCYNGIDDDGDGYVDCDDADCWSLYECSNPYCGNSVCEIGELVNTCPSDCSNASCPSQRVEVSRLSTLISIYGVTDICGPQHTWQTSTLFSGTAIMFNVTEGGNRWVTWSGASCNASTLSWQIDTSKLRITSNTGTTRTCWAICTGNGPNFCCALGTSFPAHCGTSSTPKVWINSWSN
jgi:hypothetical protein